MEKTISSFAFRQEVRDKPIKVSKVSLRRVASLDKILLIGEQREMVASLKKIVELHS